MCNVIHFLSKPDKFFIAVQRNSAIHFAHLATFQMHDLYRANGIFYYAVYQPANYERAKLKVTGHFPANNGNELFLDPLALTGCHTRRFVSFKMFVDNRTL